MANIGRVLVVASLGFLGYQLAVQFDELPEVVWSAGAVVLALAGVLLCCTTNIVGSIVWKLLLGQYGVEVTYRTSLVVFGQSQVAKYLPGNVFQYLGLVTLGKPYGIPAEAALVTIVVDVVFAIIAALLLALPGIAWRNYEGSWIVTQLLEFYPLWLAAVALGVGFLWVFRNRIEQWITEMKSFFFSPIFPVGLILHAISFIVLGLALSLILQTFWNLPHTVGWIDFTWGIALAWVAGFVVPGAPGGLGIRELILFGIYGDALGSSLAASVFFILRIYTTLADFLVFLLSRWLVIAERRRTPSGN